MYALAEENRWVSALGIFLLYLIPWYLVHNVCNFLEQVKSTICRKSDSSRNLNYRGNEAEWKMRYLNFVLFYNQVSVQHKWKAS